MRRQAATLFDIATIGAARQTDAMVAAEMPLLVMTIITLINCRNSSISAAQRTKESARKSTPSSNTNRASILSFLVNDGVKTLYSR